MSDIADSNAVVSTLDEVASFSTNFSALLIAARTLSETCFRSATAVASADALCRFYVLVGVLFLL